jgi:hypothetical protein
MCIKETLTFQNAPFGKIYGILVIRNLPEFAQMEGGIHNEEGISSHYQSISSQRKEKLQFKWLLFILSPGVFDASPIISEAMYLNKMLIKYHIFFLYALNFSMQHLFTLRC